MTVSRAYAQVNAAADPALVSRSGQACHIDKTDDEAALQECLLSTATDWLWMSFASVLVTKGGSPYGDLEKRFGGASCGIEPGALPHHLGRSADTAFASRVGQSMILGMSHPASRGWLQSSGCCLGSRWRGHAGGLAISNRAPRTPSRIRGTGYVGVADDKRSRFLCTSPEIHYPY